MKENGSYHIGAKTKHIELIRLVTRTHTAYQKSSSVIAFADVIIATAPIMPNISFFAFIFSPFGLFGFNLF